MKHNNDIFADKVVYQIYPRSFKDTDGDGIGDLRGVIDSLDYLELLGVDMIWLTPFFVSPQNDNGYDVADYRAIDPLFGTMETVEELITKAKEHKIEIMLDMVLNHTSTEHEWFKKALTGDKKYMDYYFFKDTTTNWQSKFGGPAWTYVEDLSLNYLHLFDTTQADLNWENEAVFKEVCDIVNFWLDKGITGLRFDVINLVSKPDVFEDDHVWDGRRFYTDGPRIHEHLNKLNTHTFGNRDNILTVGEMSSTSLEEGVKYASPGRNELATIFNFHHLKVDYVDNKKWHPKAFDFIELKKILAEWQVATQESGALLALFLNNHDQPRSVSRFGDVVDYHKESAKMLATAIQGMRGIVYIYQGEEIGLPNAEFNELKYYKDIESLNAYETIEGDVSRKLAVLEAHSRDNGRTPMPWDNSENHGFTTGTPWLDLSHSKALVSVEDSLKDPDSIFYHYQKLIQYRKQYPSWSLGSIEFIDLDHPQIFAYTRTLDDEVLLFVHNFYKEEVEYKLPAVGTLILSNYKDTKLEKEMRMKPFESIVMKLA